MNIPSLLSWASLDFAVFFIILFFILGIPGFTGNIGSRGYPGRQEVTIFKLFFYVFLVNALYVPISRLNIQMIIGLFY